MKTIFQKSYDGESIYDAARDFSEAFDERFNERIADIPKDQYGIQEGTFTVKIVWTLEE